MAAINESAIGVAAIGYIRIAIRGTQDGDRKTSTVVDRMPHPLHANLVITELSENISVSDRNEVVDVVPTAASGKRQATFLGNDVIELEFSEFEVQPRAMEQVVQTGIDRLNVKCAGLIGGWNYLE